MTVSNLVRQEALFIGANKQSNIADYNKTNNLVAFGASNTIALWNPTAIDNMGVYITLKKHEKEVTGVKFIQGTPYLVSVAEDGQINIWSQGANTYTLHQSIQFHTHSITCLSAINEHVFVTGSADGFIALWGFDTTEGQFTKLHHFQVKNNFYPLTLALQDIDELGNYILAVGGTTAHLYIYSFNLSSNEERVTNFKQAAVMTGHEDWIKCLTFVTESKHKSYILASGCQDRYIRLWRLRLGELIDDSDEQELKLTLLSNKQYKFELHNNRAAFNFEALIMGHDDWITGLQWHPSYVNDSPNKKLQLLSSSADTALMVWEMDEESGIWCCVNRLGEMSIKGASTATGASGGFWSCMWFVDENTHSQYILANGKTGSFRVYQSVDKEGTKFESTLGVTGLIKEVNDLVWSKSGEYFTTTSIDQTTRLFAPWQHNRSYKTWHEFARPQIHGYDMICLDNISDTKYVSGGDEKILRVFEITHSISSLLKNLCDININAKQDELPESASLPVLGLSNKAANEVAESGEDTQDQQTEEEVNQSSSENKDDILGTLKMPPTEDYLQRYTLFPEIEKLYGHGYEITCCATSPNGSLIASACRSNSAKHAVIRVFNAEQDFQQAEQVLEGHTLTITSLEFSQDGQNLVSVSRDRSLSVWKVIDEKTGEFELVELKEKAHTRIIWDCSFVPSNTFGQFFVTGSRDKHVKLWQILNNNVEMITSIKLVDAVTSVAVFPGSILSEKVIVAIGFEKGDVELYTIDLNRESKYFEKAFSLDQSITPSDRVSKLSFSSKITNNNELLLGVGSHDTSVRIYSFKKNDVV